MKTRFEKNCFSAWANTLNMGLINKVDMVCLSPVGYGVMHNPMMFFQFYSNTAKSEPDVERRINGWKRKKTRE